MPNFQHIEYLAILLVLPVLVALFWWLLQWKKNTTRRMGDEKLVADLIRDFSPKNFRAKFILAMLALALVILAASNPRRPGNMENVSRKGVDVMIALDVSKSMLAQDVKPNRLEKAKQLINRLLDILDNDRIGLVVFAGRAYMQMPLTTDHAAAKMYVQNADPDMVPTQGTVIADALTMSNTAFNSKERKYKAIVLITDGEDHDPKAPELAKQLAQDGVMINAVGIGTPDGSPIIDPETGQYKKDDQGNTVVSRLNEAELQELAGETKGIYIRLGDVDDAANVLTRQLAKIQQTSLEDNAFLNYKNYFQWFLAAALLFLVAEIFLPERKWTLS